MLRLFELQDRELFMAVDKGESMRHRMARIGVMFCGMAMAVWLAGARPMFAQEQGAPPSGEMGAPPNMGDGPPGMNVDKRLARMAKRYSLTDTQKTQVRPVLVDTKQKLDALFQDSSLAPEDRFAKIKSIHDDEVARISALMTDDQRAKYEKDEARAGEDRGPGGPGGPPPDGEGGGPPPQGDRS